MPESPRPPAVLMRGKPVAERVYSRLRLDVPRFIEESGVIPTLAVVQAGENSATRRYIRKKTEACENLGMRVQLHLFPAEIDADGLKAEIDGLSRALDIHGILVQLPLPAPIEEHNSPGTNKFDLFDAIAPEKDIDGVGRDSIAALYRAQQERLPFLACTALAVRRMIAFYGIETAGRQAVVVGRNDITAKPILHMLGGRMSNAAAIWCHRYVSRSDQERLIRNADILVTAVGSSGYSISREMVKPGVVVFDVATRIDEAGKMHGDVEEEVRSVASCLSPVPGGVGPVTVAALTENLLRAAKFTCGFGEPGYEF